MSLLVFTLLFKMTCPHVDTLSSCQKMLPYIFNDSTVGLHCVITPHTYSLKIDERRIVASQVYKAYTIHLNCRDILAQPVFSIEVIAR